MGSVNSCLQWLFPSAPPGRPSPAIVARVITPVRDHIDVLTAEQAQAAFISTEEKVAASSVYTICPVPCPTPRLQRVKSEDVEIWGDLRKAHADIKSAISKLVKEKIGNVYTFEPVVLETSSTEEPPLVQVKMKPLMPDTAMVPADGLQVKISEAVPISRLVDALSKYFKTSQNKVSILHSGECLKPDLPLKEQAGVTLPAPKARAKRTLELKFKLDRLCEPMRKALEDYIRTQAAEASTERIVESNFFTLTQQQTPDEAQQQAPEEANPQHFMVQYSPTWADFIHLQVQRLTAMTNLSYNDLMNSGALVINSATGQNIRFDDLCDKAGEDLRSCFPLDVAFVPRVAGERLPAPDDLRLDIERLMNNSSTNESQRFSVVSVFINRNDSLWQRYCKFKDSMVDVRSPLQPAPRTAIQSSSFGMLRGDLNEHMLFHGTAIDSAVAIAGSSFDLDMANKGAFGQGMYFADSPLKSHQFSRLSGGVNFHTMLLCRVACGNVKVVTQTGAYGLTNLVSNNEHCVRGEVFQHPEFIIYREEQCYPEYIILYQVTAR